MLDDVIVVGAGPAGNNTAYGLARRGHSVTVIDAKDSIGDKLCTGIVGQECLRAYPIDPALVYRRADSARVITPHGDSVPFRTTAPQAAIIDRVSYVASFARLAQAAGARYITGQKVKQIRRAGGSVLVQTDDDEYSARGLVLAAGFGSPLIEQLGLEPVRDFVTGVQATVSTREVQAIEVHLGRKLAPGFFAWFTPTKPNEALIGLLSRRNSRQLLNSFIRQMGEAGKLVGVVKLPRNWGIPLRPLKRSYQDRVLVVGDAAGQVKPITGGGIYYSLLSGDIAADVLEQSLARNDLSAASLSQYQRRWRALLAPELETGYVARRLFELLSDRQISALVVQAARNNICEGMGASSGTDFDWHGRLIGKIVSRTPLGRALRRLNPLLGRSVQTAGSSRYQERSWPVPPTN